MEWREELGVAEEEMLDATSRIASRVVAPGPNRVAGRIWAETIAPRLCHLFARYLREGVYPRIWRMARLVLLRKEGQPTDSPSAYHPMCLLDEVGKLFERVFAVRLEAHMSGQMPLARKPVRLWTEPLDGGYGEPGAGDVTGRGFSGWGSACSLFRYSQCIQNHTLGRDIGDPWIFWGTSLRYSCHTSLPERQMGRLH